VSLITNDTECLTANAADNIHAACTVIKSLHKITLSSFLSKQCPTPIIVEIDARNPVDEIHMCLIDCPIMLGRRPKQALLKEAVYTQVQNIGIPRTKRELTLAEAPHMSCAVKLLVKSRGCSINIWFLISVHKDPSPQLFVTKQDKKRKLEENENEKVYKYARTAVEDEIPDVHDTGLLNEIFDQGLTMMHLGTITKDWSGSYDEESPL